MSLGDIVFFAAAGMAALLLLVILWRASRPPYLFALFLSLIPAHAQELYVNFEDIAAGTTDSAINMGTISKTNGSAVTFSWTGSAGKVSVENGGLNMGLLRPVTVAGTSYTNHNPSKHLLCKSDNTVSTVQKFTWTFAAASRKISLGFFITLSNFTGSGAFYNPGGLEAGGTYSVLSMINENPLTFQAETNSDVGANITVFNNSPIWVTALWDSANGKTIWDFYNGTNMVLLGRSSGATVVNATINTLTWGITDAHSKNSGTAYRMNNLILYTNGTQWPVWPGGNLHVPTNMTPTGVAAAHTAATDGDFIILPATNATWTSGVTISKNNLKFAGLGSQAGQGTNTTVIIADGVFDAFTVSGNFNTISNFQLRGDLVNDEADGFLVSGSHNRFSQLYIRELENAFYIEDFGLIDNCVVADCKKISRNIFPVGFYDTYYPLAWDSTNFMVYEDNHFYWTSAKNEQGSENLMSSQVAQAFCVRHNYFEFTSGTSEIQPAFDFHGDAPPYSSTDSSRRPGIALQIYSNYFNDIIGSVSGSKFIDHRGSRGLFYSNRWVGSQLFSSGDGIFSREEFPASSPTYQVNATYIWENKHGASGTTAMPVNDDGNVSAGVDYFTTALTPLVQIPYPHPMRAAAASDDPVIPASRRYDWATWSGIPGGIPRYTTIYTNLGAYVGLDISTHIQNAINNMPTGQVIYIPAGTYDISGQITINKSRIVIRGDGPRATILRYGGSGPGSSSIYVHDSDNSFNYSSSTKYNLLTNFIAGASNVSVTATLSGIAAGDYVYIDQKTNTGSIFSDGDQGNGPCTFCGRSGDRTAAKMFRVESVSNGTNLVLLPPVAGSFYGTNSPQLMKVIDPIQFSGMDSLCITNIVGSATESYTVAPSGTVGWFMTNTLLSVSYNRHVYTLNSMWMELRQNFLHLGNGSDWTSAYGPDRAYGVYMGYGTCHALIADNIFEHLHFANSFEGGVQANVFYGNFFTNSIYNTDRDTAQPSFGSHGGFTEMNLVEQNIVWSKFLGDLYWGNGDSFTIFRNRIANNITQDGTTVSQYALIFDIWNLHRNYNIVGNILGRDTMETKVYIGNGDSINSGGVKAIYRFGGSDANDTTYSNFDGQVTNTMILKANYNFVTDGVPTLESVGSTNLANSYYYASKPSWWGVSNWPSIGPDKTPTSEMSMWIPAKGRFYAMNGAGTTNWLPAESGNPLPHNVGPPRVRGVRLRR